MLYDTYDRAWGPTTRPQYNQYPYVRIKLPDGRELDGRATAWTTGKIHCRWLDPDAPPRQVAWVITHVQEAWMDTHHVERIKRKESSWQDENDDFEHFERQGEL